MHRFQVQRQECFARCNTVDGANETPLDQPFRLCKCSVLQGAVFVVLKTYHQLESPAQPFAAELRLPRVSYHGSSGSITQLGDSLACVPDDLLLEQT